MLQCFYLKIENEYIIKLKMLLWDNQQKLQFLKYSDSNELTLSLPKLSSCRINKDTTQSSSSQSSQQQQQQQEQLMLNYATFLGVKLTANIKLLDWARFQFCNCSFLISACSLRNSAPFNSIISLFKS